MIKILVIEDEPDIADFIRRGLLLKGFEVFIANTGNQGLEMAHDNNPEMVILDLMLPDSDGIDICRELRKSGNMGIIILTARSVVGERVRGLEAGADDYLPKPFAFEALLARIQAGMSRRSPEAAGINLFGDLVIDTGKRQAFRNGRAIDLTTREFDLLKLLAEHRGRPLSREFIIQRIWGNEFEGETDPVKVYINFLRKKLNTPGEKDLIHSIRGFGYSLEEQ
jgi:DNA-binding response OmpR family regulator